MKVKAFLTLTIPVGLSDDLCDDGCWLLQML